MYVRFQDKSGGMSHTGSLTNVFTRRSRLSFPHPKWDEGHFRISLLGQFGLTNLLVLLLVVACLNSNLMGRVAASAYGSV